MKDITQKIDKYLITEAFKPDDIEGYDVAEAREKLKELVKQFGGREMLRGEDGVILWPFKRGDNWEVYVTIEDYDPLTYEITVTIYDNLLNFGGSFDITTNDIDDKIITKVGLMQKRYYETAQSVWAEARKIGKVE